jgi:hypothetical protein
VTGNRNGSPALISAVGVVTRDRPASLTACLVTYLENCRRYHRAPEFLVCDDSGSADVRGAVRADMQRLHLRFGAHLRYAGPPERLRFADALARESGVPREIIRFALLGDDRCAISIGANRNSLLLETVGALVLGVDDDTQCRTAAVPEADATPNLFAGYDPTTFWFFPDLDSALESVPAMDADVLGAHEALLGRAIGEVVGDAGVAGRIALTLHGLVGDSGMASPRYLLTLTGQSWTHLVASRDAYRSAFRSRQVLRAVTRPTITPGPFCMTTFLGFDNRRLLPPFFPVQRNADGVFGMVVQHCIAGSAIAFLPSVLLHRPPVQRMYETNDLWNASANVRMSDIVFACVRAHTGNVEQTTDAARLVDLGLYLQQLGALAFRDFEAYVGSLQRYRATAFVTALAAALETHSAQPDFWADDVKRMIASMSAVANANKYAPPTDLSAIDAARPLAQELLARFGELLEAWPAIVDAAARLHDAGVRMTAPPGGDD